MCGKQIILDVLDSRYGCSGVLKYSESDGEIRFQLPTPILDKQTEVFRSRATALNDLAIGHRFSLLIARAKYRIPEDSSFAIKSIETSLHRIEVVHGYEISLAFEILTKRRESITAIRSTLVTRFGVEARVTKLSFNIFPPLLAGFVRRARHFLDYADVKMSRENSSFSTVAENHLRYHPSENDRLSDGKRVDHVPALVLVDIALFVSAMDQEAASPGISAEFLNYTDPRRAFDIVTKKDHNAIEFLQEGQTVAIVYYRGCPACLGEALRS
jgi:hypothetical protein